jgi:hypothetical protein
LVGRGISDQRVLLERYPHRGHKSSSTLHPNLNLNVTMTQTYLLQLSEWDTDRHAETVSSTCREHDSADLVDETVGLR